VDRGKKRHKANQDTMEFMKDIGWVPGIQQNPNLKNPPFIPHDYSTTDANFALQPTPISEGSSSVKEGGNARGGVARFMKPKANRSMSFRSNNDSQGYKSNSQQWPRR